MKSSYSILIITLLLLLLSASICFSQDQTPPTIIKQISDQSINEDQYFRLELKLDEIFSDENPLSFSIDKKNADWLANVGDSILVGFPLEEHVGDYEIDVKATDSSDNFSTTTFTISVNFVDDKPIVLKNLPGQLQRPGFGELKVSYKGIFYDEEDESLNYSVESSYPAVATAELIGDSILVTEKGIGPAEIILTATDDHGNKAKTKMFIRVYEEAEVLNMTTGNTGSNSLADNRATCVRNDASGNLWVGHRDRISRYKDGRWEQFQFDHTDVYINEIWDDGNGNVLFIASYSILKYNNQEFSFINIGQEDGPPQYIKGHYIAKDSSLFIVGFDQYHFLIKKNNGDNWETVYSTDRNELSSGVYYKMCTDSNDNIWLATGTEGLCFIENGIRSNFSVENNITKKILDVDVDLYGCIWFISSENIYKYNPKEDKIRKFTGWRGLKCIFADNIGNIWAGTSGNLIRIKDDKVHQIELKNPTPKDFRSIDNFIRHIFKTNDGKYWFCSDKGLYISENFLVKGESTILQHNFDGLPSNNILDIKRDLNGVYWFNTIEGLSAFNGNQWNYYGRLLEVLSIDNNGRKICRDWSYLVIIDEQNNKINYSSGFTKIYDIECDKNNNIWISGRGNQGLVKFDGSNWSKYSVDDGLSCDTTNVLFADSKGNIWISYAPTSIGIITKFDGSTFTHFTESDGIGSAVAFDFLEDLDGNIWMATWDGLFKFDGEDWTNYHTIHGLKNNGIQSLALDYAGGIWITYSAYNHSFGVSRFDGTKFDHFTTKDGLPTNKIKKVYVDHVLTNQNKSTSLNDEDAKELIWLGSQDKGAANFYLQNATSVIDHNLPEMKAIVFPNPTAGITNIILDNQQREYLDIEVHSIDGKKVYQNNTSHLQSKVQINLSSHQPGTYFIRLKSDIDSVVKKIILN